jgi:TPR repeat protein
VARDLALAYYWYAQAAAQGDPTAGIKAREVLDKIGAR